MPQRAGWCRPGLAVTLPDLGCPVAVTAAAVRGAVIPVARMVSVIHLTWPDAPAQGVTVILPTPPAETATQPPHPVEPAGERANSTGNDFSWSLSPRGRERAPIQRQAALTSSIRGRTGRLRARSSCDWYSLTYLSSPTRYNP